MSAKIDVDIFVPSTILVISNPENVNKRRKEAGFDTTVEENALRFGIIYKAYTYEQLRKIL